jgi:hypothetical protein
MSEYNNIYWLLFYMNKKGKRIVKIFESFYDANQYILNKELRNFKLIQKESFD